MEIKYQPLKFGVHELLTSWSLDAREMMESCHLPVAALVNGDKLEMLAIHLNLWLIKELDLISNFDQKMQEYCRNTRDDG